LVAPYDGHRRGERWRLHRYANERRRRLRDAHMPSGSYARPAGRVSVMLTSYRPGKIQVDRYDSI
jgi:hypothetical protein